MVWILNDLSLINQFNNTEEFSEKISELLRAKAQHDELKSNFFCSRNIHTLPILDGKPFSEIVQKNINPNLKSLILSWATKNGPFWTDTKENVEDNYFEYESIDVTDLGLGECARKAINSSPVYAYSFPGQFSKSPLDIQHGIAEDPIGIHRITNTWTPQELIQSANKIEPSPKNWPDAISKIRKLFPCLLLSDAIINQLKPVPFSAGVYQAVLRRFNVLHDYIHSRNDRGLHTQETDGIIAKHFQGDKAWFSDSSVTECAQFKKELTFIDPRTGNRKLFPFHGKIKTPQLRIHFEWPIAPDQNEINIVYWGPKITKR